jgi:hypothetical protein
LCRDGSHRSPTASLYVLRSTIPISS